MLGWLIAVSGLAAVTVAGGVVGHFLGSSRVGIEVMTVVDIVCGLYVFSLLPVHIRWSVRGQRRQYQAARQRIERLLHPVIDQAHVFAPHVVIIPVDAVNAYAAGVWPWRPTIGVTEGALERLRDDELQAVLAHEVGHIVHHDTIVLGWWSAFLGILSGVGLAALLLASGCWLSDRRQSSDGKDDTVAVLGAFFAIIAIVVGVVAFTVLALAVRWDMRRRETLADAEAILWISDPRSLSRALRKMGSNPEVYDRPSTFGFLYSVSPVPRGSWVERLWDTHPPMDRRIQRIEQLAERMTAPGSAEMPLLSGETQRMQRTHDECRHCCPGV